MNNSTTEVKEFNLMGQKVIFRSDAKDYKLAEEVIQNIEEEISELNLTPSQDTKERLLLLLLKMTLDKIKLEDKYRESLDHLEASVEETLEFLKCFSVQKNS